MKDIIHESHSIVPADPQLDKFQRLGLLLLGIGLATLFSSLFKDYSSSGITLWVTLLLIFAGGLTYGLRTHLKRAPGIQNNGIMTSSVSSRGAIGWMVGVTLTSLYTLYYWWPEYLEGMTRLFDPLSQFIRQTPADQWFMYGTFYTVGVTIMGVKAIAKYRHSKYQIYRTTTIILAQFFMAYTIPYLMSAFYNLEYYPTYFWPLQWKALFPDGEVMALVNSPHQVIAMCMLAWSLVASFIATPFLTYYLGKRWYCSWVCGCGGLANTAGDSWRQLSSKKRSAWKLERYTIYSVLGFIIIVTAYLWTFHLTQAEGMKESAGVLAKVYGFLIGSVMAGVVGTGLYPLLGTRIWCRFACPMAAILGIIQRFKSRFRITTNGGQCISCGNCSTYCEMGIDVRWYAQRGQDIVRASCVGCGMCSAVCPRGVLQLENGPTEQRAEYQMDLLSSMKARKLEDK